LPSPSAELPPLSKPRAPGQPQVPLKSTLPKKVVCGGGREISTKKLPKGVPKFKKGQKLKFTFAKKGELKGPRFSIPLLDSSSTVINSYSNSQSKNFDPKFQITASVRKDSKGNAIGILIDVTKMEIKGVATSTTYKAIYVMGEAIN
jgi:hypothetical protein